MADRQDLVLERLRQLVRLGRILRSECHVPLPANFAASAHVGYSDGDYWGNATSATPDWSVGLTYPISHFTLGLKWVDGSDLADLDDFCHGLNRRSDLQRQGRRQHHRPRAIFSDLHLVPVDKE